MLASSVVLGTLAGLVMRGSWKNLRGVQVHWWPLAFVALAMRVVGLIVPLPVAGYVAAIVLAAVIAARNFRLAGAPLIAAGCLLNALVIALNGGMPFDTAAAEAVGARPLLNDRLHIAIGPETRLTHLADVIPLGVFRNVYSAGDLLIAAGGFWVPFALLRRR